MGIELSGLLLQLRGIVRTRRQYLHNLTRRKSQEMSLFWRIEFCAEPLYV